jgi:hypothetical protein
VAAVAPLPQRLGGQGRGMTKRCGGERWGVSSLEWGKSSGVVGKARFIGVQPGADTRKVQQASIARGINGTNGF